MAKLIIGFCGYAGAGKDTAANAAITVLRAYNRTAARVAFADPMRDMLAALGVPANHMYDRALKEAPIASLSGHSYRKLAQTLGTEWGRNCLGEDFWVDAAFARVQAADVDAVLITDVRFPNEAARINAAGGFLARVTRPGLERVNPHPSEEHVANFVPDYEILNDGDILLLANRVSEMVSKCIERR